MATTVYRVIDKTTRLFLRDDITFDSTLEEGVISEQPPTYNIRSYWNGNSWEDNRTDEEIANSIITGIDAYNVKVNKEEIALRIKTADKGIANGVASLDSNGKVPSAQLPSYVDDVLEYTNLASFPTTGVSGKIYVAIDTGFQYRWGGSLYIEISKSLIIGEDSENAYSGAKGKANAEAIASIGEEVQTNIEDIRILQDKSYSTNIYGIDIDETTGDVIRLFDAVGKTISTPDGTGPITSDFDNIYPFSGIRHVKVSENGSIREQEDVNYDSFDGEIMTYIPQFYYKDWRDSGHRYCLIADTNLSGYTKAWQDEDYGLIASFNASLVNGEYRSRINEAPKTIVSYTSFLTAFYSKGDGKWSMYDANMMHNLFLLSCIEAGSINHKASYGRGINSGMPYSSSGYDIKTASTGNNVTVDSSKSFYIGMTVQIGTAYSNNSIASDRKITAIVDNEDGTQTLTVDGDSFSVAVGNTCVTWGQSVPEEQYSAIGDGSGYILQWESSSRSHVCYRGIWDLWGNIWQLNAGFMRYDGQYYGCCDKSKYNITDPRNADGWTDLGLNIQSANGYQKTRQAIKIDGGSIDVPVEWGSVASSETFYSAYLYNFTSAETGTRVLLLGGHWISGGNVSLVCSYGLSAPSSASISVGSRLIR